MKPLLILCFVLASNNFVHAQTDLLVLKQRNQTIQTWIPGSVITFEFSSKQWIQGIIKAIRNDSIVLELIRLERVANRFGFVSIDTAKMGLMKLHVSEIYGMPKRNAGGGLISSGSLFQLGSGAYLFLNVFNTLIHNENLFESQNIPRLSIAAGIFLVGTVLASTHKDFVVLGKKYTMETIHVGNGTPFSKPVVESKSGL